MASIAKPVPISHVAVCLADIRYIEGLLSYVDVLDALQRLSVERSVFPRSLHVAVHDVLRTSLDVLARRVLSNFTAY